MNVIGYPFTLLDYQQDCFLIKSKADLTSTVTDQIREAIKSCSQNDYSIIYLNAKDAVDVDLSGINEVINSHYTLQQHSKKLVFVYKRNSEVEKWVETTGLNKFIETAIVN